MRRLVTAQADVADAVATRDRAAQADALLDVACKAAVDMIRRGRPGRAEYVLARDGLRAERILGGAVVVQLPGRTAGGAVHG